ncbi:MAG: Gfo/Idh/MocA family oxidoreductase [Pirellulaceae bacterium]|jgi:predicted dehydrogenase|nr:Gfo/Idh/MocA family oxidoreductase [Pirellulaceae bacterium]MDP7018393.1 Gfo/Idh/MocA family oxidoreductase [Pirellulaceae bacterium]
MSENNRRTFIQQAAGAGVATVALSAVSESRGANERVRVGLIGCGGRGRGVADMFRQRNDVDLVYLADPNNGRLTQAAAQFGGKIKTTGDFREMIDGDSVDAVIVATPVHWHAPATVVCCRAGKHVYVEKPCSHNLREGRVMVEAARAHDCVVQHGTQVRSTSTMIEAVDALRNGVIGKVLTAKAWNIQRRPGAGRGANAKPPRDLDFEMWLGPVPPIEYYDGVISQWNWSRHFGTGEIGNDGIHDIEYARWGLGVDQHPQRIAGMGGRYTYHNGAEFPDTQQVCYEFAAENGSDKQMLIYEERLWSTNYPHNCDSGVEFYGDRGQMFLSRRGKCEVHLDRNQRKPLDIKLEAQNTNSHIADFIDAIRNKRRSNADIELGHLTTSLCHLGNIAIRLGRNLQFDHAAEQFKDDQEANSLLVRTYRDDHWAKL